MFVSKNLGINAQGHLTIGGADSVNLVEQYATPLYVIDEDLVREHCQQFKQSIDQYYDGNGLVCYASKALSCKEIYRIMKDEKMGVDVVSVGELYTALSVDFPAENICFHGNNKTAEELIFALEHGVGRIVVDNLTELNKLDTIAKEMLKCPNILLRVKPGVDAHTHSFIRTGQIDSKFGFAIETGEALEAAKEATSMNNVNLVGAHCHIGSQIFDIDPFVLAAQVMLEYMAKIKETTGVELSELNLGGGFGIKYTDEDAPVPYENYMEKVSTAVKSYAKQYGLAVPFILLEPGRSIIAPAGVTLYTVGARKEIPDVRTYISIDGGMTDNPRYALYQSKYDVLLANKANQPKDDVVTIAGKCCESGDLIGEGMPIQHAEAGDIVAVLATGAYNYSMSSNYNRVAKPPVVVVKGGKSRIAVKRETLEDIIRNDI